ncbi:unnamed protein product [Blepharisma stoltei]|uniref:WWE domain-containing protein n=1 Tax=Blepharisma stoltei TaxID=1481888 RepID=A0AAU9K4F4_9CILI|nr:unnamed protein product [Blepharisma stoltei]
MNPQNPHPAFKPPNYNSPISQRTFPNANVQPGPQVINPQIPAIKLNPLVRQNPEPSNLPAPGSESLKGMTDISVPKYQTNQQFNPLGAVFPVKADSSYQDTSSQEGSYHPHSNQGMPIKGPSIPRQFTQNNTPSSHAPQQMITPKIPQNDAPMMKAPPFIKNTPQINQANQINPQFQREPNLQSQIIKPNQLDSQVSNPIGPQSFIKSPNQPTNQVPSSAGPPPLVKPPNQSNQPFQLPSPPIFLPPSNQMGQLNNQIQNPQNFQSQQPSQFLPKKYVPPPSPQNDNQVKNAQNLQPQQLIRGTPQAQFVPNPTPQNMQEGTGNLQNFQPNFTPPNFGPNIPPPPLHGQNYIGSGQVPKASNQIPTPSADESNKFVRPPPPPPEFFNPPNVQNPTKPPQGDSIQNPNNPQSESKFPLSGINSGPPFIQQIANSVEGTLPDLKGSLPQGIIPRMAYPPQPQNPTNALLINPAPLRVHQEQDFPKFTPNNPPRGNSIPLNQPFDLSRSRMASLNNSSSIDSDMQNSPPSNGLLQVESIPCPPQLASRLNRRNITADIKRKYMLTTATYDGTAFNLTGSPSSVQQASEELKKIITQESQLGNVFWEWLRDDGSLEAYPPAINEIIENAYNRGENWAAIPIKGQTYRVIFGDPHVQVVLNSKISRTVRRNDGSQASVDRKLNENEVTWYWQDDDKIFKKYTAEASRQIEAAYQQRSKALIQGSNIRGYLLDFDQMKQQNEKTKFSRTIRRGE